MAEKQNDWWFLCKAMNRLSGSVAPDKSETFKRAQLRRPFERQTKKV